MITTTILLVVALSLALFLAIKAAVGVYLKRRRVIPIVMINKPDGPSEIVKIAFAKVIK